MSEPAQGGPLRVCLIGPTTGGKTELLAALMAGTKSGSHGFPISLGLSCEFNDERLQRPQTHAERIKRILDDRRRIDPRNPATLAAAGHLAATNPEAPPAEYEFRLSFRRGSTKGVTAPTTFVVADAAGEHIFPERAPTSLEVEADQLGHPITVARDRFLDLVAQSVGIVIVVPLYRLAQRKFNQRMDTVIDALTPVQTSGSRPALQRIAIALSQYERLFTGFGGDAAVLATHPEVVRSVIKSRVRDAPWMSRLRELDHSWGGWCDVRIVPTSAYGFLPDFGNPNIDAEAKDANSPFMSYEDVTTDTREYERYPFLHADPFIFAATGHVNSYMMGIKAVYGDLPANANMRRPSDRATRSGSGKADVFDRITRHVSSFFEI